MSTALLVVQALGKQVVLADQPLSILDNVSLTLHKGESLAIVGASGSGKSTFLGLLAGLDTPSSGHISLNGHALEQLSEDARAAIRAEQVGFVFQQFHLLAALTALENVALPLELAGQLQPFDKAEAILRRVGLGHRLKHYPRQLSGGEQQRVALARAFVGTPSLLFADEPTGNLDTQTGKQIIDLLFELNQEHGTTLVLVTHDPQLAARCQRQITLEAGRLL
jgi:putative ABC transport system ATP-binding protein